MKSTEKKTINKSIRMQSQENKDLFDNPGNINIALLKTGKEESMNESTLVLDFKGYWTEQNLLEIPAETGVYCVYLYHDDGAVNEIIPRMLLYIGYAENVRERLASHEKHSQWKELSGYCQQLCYTFAKVSETELVSAGDAMIFRHKPPENNISKEWCFSRRTIVFCEGKTPFLYSLFEVGE